VLKFIFQNCATLSMRKDLHFVRHFLCHNNTGLDNSLSVQLGIVKAGDEVLRRTMCCSDLVPYNFHLLPRLRVKHFSLDSEHCPGQTVAFLEDNKWT
jgi:hypothetical protein